MIVWQQHPYKPNDIIQNFWWDRRNLLHFQWKTPTWHCKKYDLRVLLLDSFYICHLILMVMLVAAVSYRLRILTIFIQTSQAYMNIYFPFMSFLLTELHNSS